MENRTGFLRNCHEHRVINKHNNNDSLVYKLLLTTDVLEIVMRTSLNIYKVSTSYKLPPPKKKTNMAMDNPPFEDVFPIEHGDFPLHFASFFRGVTETTTSWTSPYKLEVRILPSCIECLAKSL